MITLRPSSAAIWAGAGCTAFPAMAAKFKDADMSNDAAAEGTAAHWVAEHVLRFGGAPKSPTAPNGVAVTGEMVAAVTEYAHYAASLQGAAHVEERVEVFDTCSGTPDLWVYDQASGTLHVVDYKHGFGRVEAERNWQMALYAGGLIRKLPDVKAVKITVVQPRAYHPDGPIRTWDASKLEVQTMVAEAVGASMSIRKGITVAKSGSHCKYCPGRYACPAAVDAALTLYEASTNAAPYDLADWEMGTQYAILQRAAEQIGFLLTSYEAQLKSALYAGKPVSGWRLEPTAPRMAWASNPAEVFALGEMLGLDLRQDRPITPKQAIEKGVDTSVIKEYTTNNSKGHNVVAVTTTHAQRIFN